jgi:MFS family permease
MVSSLRWNTTRAIILISFFSSLYFYLPVLTLYYQQRGLNFVQINSLWGIIVGTQFLAEVPTGIVADVIGRKRAFSLALLLQFIGEFLYLFADSYAFFVVVSVIAGLGFAFASGCMEALVYDSLEGEDRSEAMQRAMGAINAAARAGGIVAFTIGGFLIADLQQSRFLLAIALTAGAVGVAFVVSVFIRDTHARNGHSDAHPFALVREGVQLLRQNLLLRRIVLLALLTDPFGDYLLNLYQPYFLLSSVSGLWFGLALAGAALLGVVASQYAYLLERRLGVQQAVLLATGLPGLIYLVMALVIHPVFSVLLFCVQGGAINIKRPLFAAYTNAHIDSRNRATVLSLINMASGLYVALMGLVIGFAADQHSVPAAFGLMGVIVVIGALLLQIDERFVTPASPESPPPPDPVDRAR